MVADQALTAALRPFERRAVFVAFVEAMIASALVLVLTAEAGFVFGWRSRGAFFVVVAIAIALSVVYAYTRRPAVLALARRIDARGRMKDLIVTAVTCDGDGLASLVRRSAIAELARFPRASAYPIEAPRHWRRGLLAAAVAQFAILPFAFRPPVERAAAQNLTALTLPPAAGAAAPGAPAKSADPARTSSAPATPQAPTASKQLPGAAETLPVGAAAGSGDSGAGNAADRVRLAAMNAKADIAAGRVPLARRAIVTRYFAAIDNQRKPPR